MANSLEREEVLLFPARFDFRRSPQHPGASLRAPPLPQGMGQKRKWQRSRGRPPESTLSSSACVTGLTGASWVCSFSSFILCLSSAPRRLSHTRGVCICQKRGGNCLLEAQRGAGGSRQGSASSGTACKRQHLGPADPLQVPRPAAPSCLGDQKSSTNYLLACRR